MAAQITEGRLCTEWGPLFSGGGPSAEGGPVCRRRPSFTGGEPV